MQILTTLDLLYIVLSLFVTIIWVLLTIALIRLVKILWVVQEISGYYYDVKKYMAMYAKIPSMIKDKIFDIIGKKK